MKDKKTTVNRHTGLISKALVLMALFFVVAMQILALPVDVQAQSPPGVSPIFNSVGVPMTGPNDRCGEEIWSLFSTPPGPVSHGTFLGIHDGVTRGATTPFPLVPADCANPTPNPGRIVANSYDSSYAAVSPESAFSRFRDGRRPWPVPDARLFNLPLRTIPVPAGNLVRAPIPLPGAVPPNPLPPTVTRPTFPITLGYWLSATGALTSECAADFTSASFSLTMSNLIPNGVYTVWGVWTDLGGFPLETPLGGLPNTLVADGNGDAQWVRDLDFCLHQQSPNGNRLQYISIAYHADGVTYGTLQAEHSILNTFVGLPFSPPFQSTAPLGAVTFPQLGFRVRATGGPDPAPPTTPDPVLDTTAPVFTPPLAVTLEATSSTGAPASYSTPAATDDPDPNPMVICTPATGILIPIGTTTVNCTATDNAGNEGTTSFVITVVDTTAPVIAATANITAEATGPAGAPVSYTPPTATDLGGGIGVTCLPASGGIFPIGTTNVACTATDAAGNEATTSFAIAVQDTTPPLMMAPSNISIVATDESGAVVSYTSPEATDLVDGLTAVRCIPVSGGTFPIGTTTVVCTSQDTRLNTATVRFDIAVEGITPRTIKADAVAALIVMRDAETDPRLIEDYNKAIDDVNNSLNPAYWDGIQPSTVEEFDATGVSVGLLGENIFRFELHACKLIEKELKENLSGPVSANLTEVQEMLYAADRELVQTALDASAAAFGDVDHLLKSEASIADGDAAVEVGECDAIKSYKDGWVQAVSATPGAGGIINLPK